MHYDNEEGRDSLQLWTTDARCPPKQAGAEKEDNATAEKRKEGDSDTHRVGHGRIHGGNFYLEER